MTRGAALLAAMLALAPAAWAERGDREKEIVVGADRLTADDANRTSTFEGNVVVTQGTMRMTAGRVVVREDAQRHKFYVASGAPDTSASSRRMSYEMKSPVISFWLLFTRARL